jgi:predicted nucleic acid-binding protein
LSVVLDASMTIAWLFEDEATDAARAVFHLVSREGAIVPSLWALEVVNALRIGVRRGRCDDEFVDGSLADLRLLPIRIDAETGVRAWRETLDLSRKNELTIYDASYLELAVREELPIATADSALARAAARNKIPILTR